MPVLKYKDAGGNWRALNSKGPKGFPGDTGPKGYPGPQGDAGPIGTPGPKGATGDQGPIGDKGATGPQGATGDRGATGATGGTGATGSYGDAHDRWQMCRGEVYVPGGSGNYSSAWGALGATYASKPDVICTGASSVMGSTVKGVAVDTNDTVNVLITVLRTNATGTYVNFVAWGVLW
jgi:hypothetical protein